MKKLSEEPIKVVALEISHTKGQVISGGDKLLEEMFPYLSSKISITVIIPQIAAWHWQKKNARIVTLRKNIFDDKLNLAAVSITYILRIAKSTKILLSQQKKGVIYSSTNIFPDVFPAFIAKLINSKIIWFARIHHLIPNPLKRDGNLIVNSVSYLAQEISLACLKKADKIAILNENIQSTLIEKGFDESKLVIIPAGISSEKWHFEKSRKKFDAIFLGRLHPSKGINDLIPIWKLVCQKLPKAKLIIAGQGQRNTIEKLKKEVKQANLVSNIKIKGPIYEKKVKGIISYSKIFLFTDHEAGFGIAPLEAMALGLPVVGYDLGILGKTFKQGYIKINPFDINSFSKTVINLLNNPQKLKRMSSMAKKESQAHTWPKIVKYFEKLVVALSEKRIERKNTKDWLLPVFIFFITVIFITPFAIIGVDPHHDGIIFKPALDVSTGLQLFRETFTQYGPLTVLIQALSLKMFGSLLATIKLTAVIFYAGTGVLLYKVWSLFLSKKIALFAWIIWLLLAPYLVLTFLAWSSVYALFFQSLSLYFFLKQAQKSNYFYLFFAGVSSALTFWSRQPVGFLLLCAQIAFLIIITIGKIDTWQKFSKKFLILIFGFIMISVFFFSWLILTNSLKDWWLQTIILAFEFGKINGNGYSLFSLIQSLFVLYKKEIVTNLFFWSLVPLTVLFLFLKSLFYIFTNKFKADPFLIPLLSVSLICLASWLQYFPSADIRHVYWAATPMLGFYFYTILKIPFSRKKIYYRSLKFIMIFPLIIVLISQVQSSYGKINKTYVSVNEPNILKGLLLSESEAEFYEDINIKIKIYQNSHLEKNFIILGRDSIYLGFAKTENVLPAFFQDNLLLTIYPDQNIKLDAYIAQNQPLILTSSPNFPKNYEAIGTWQNLWLIAPITYKQS